MKPACLFIALSLFTIPDVSRQEQSDSKPGNPEYQTGQNQDADKILDRIRQSLGGSGLMAGINSLSIIGKSRYLTRSADHQRDLKIEFLRPDKFQKVEKSIPRPTVIVTYTQTVNGGEVWVDRVVQSRRGTDDGSAEFDRRTLSRSSPIRTETRGMRSTATGNTIIDTKLPGDQGEERTTLGMKMPAITGPDTDNYIERLEQAKIASTIQPKKPGTNTTPGIEIPDVKSELERHARSEAISMMLAILLNNPGSFPLQLSYAGSIDTENGKVEALEISGPENFAARLFIDQASMRPVSLNYREILRRNTGYLVSATGRPRDEQMEPEVIDVIAIQLYFLDYRPVDGLLLPHQIVKAANGVPVEEWRIDKYKLNPRVKSSKFDKK